METMFDTLLQLPLFQGLCNEDFTSILEKVKLHFIKHKAGETIIENGSACTQLCFLLKGEVSIVTNSPKNIYTVIEQMEALKRYIDLKNKIIRFFLLHCEKTQGEKIFKVKMDDLARYLDDTRLNTSKALNELQDNGVLELRRKEILIPDAVKLVND